MDTVERFWAKVDRSRGPDACWMWTACKDRQGYGKFGHSVEGKMKYVRAHRFAYEANGRELGAAYALHRCDTPSCVNPAHLFPGTALDNANDCTEKGRRATGARARPDRRLPDDVVHAIRAASLAGETCRSIAGRHPATFDQVRRVINGRNYRCVVTSSADQ
jgi:hypothetical protein